jgi:hypothetical protein
LRNGCGYTANRSDSASLRGAISLWTAWVPLPSFSWSPGAMKRTRSCSQAIRLMGIGAVSLRIGCSPRRSWIDCCPTQLPSTSAPRATGCARNNKPDFYDRPKVVNGGRHLWPKRPAHGEFSISQNGVSHNVLDTARYVLLIGHVRPVLLPVAHHPLDRLPLRHHARGGFPLGLQHYDDDVGLSRQ